jgi:hypothetical protein
VLEPGFYPLAESKFYAYIAIMNQIRGEIIKQREPMANSAANSPANHNPVAEIPLPADFLIWYYVIDI